MPTYEYACTACGERTEARQGFDDPPLESCPVCGGKLRKLYSPVGIVFKGSGFYSTDRRSSAKASGGRDDKPKEPAGSDGKSEKGKSEKKADDKKGSTPPKTQERSA